MKNRNNNDNLANVLILSLLVVFILVAISFIPSFNIGKTRIKRVNILSDLYTFNDYNYSNQTSINILDTTFLADAVSDEQLNELIMANTTATNIASPEQTEAHTVISNGAGDEVSSNERHLLSTNAIDKADTKASVPQLQKRKMEPSKSQYHDSVKFMSQTHADVDTLGSITYGSTNSGSDGGRSRDFVHIEDFSSCGMMDRFYSTLSNESAGRTVRIAVLGDSFIESDIFTCDLREQLQSEWGGNGVGFVPFSNPLSTYRATVKHEYSGWDNYSIIKKKQVPEDFRSKFFVSGILSVPQQSATAWSRFEGVKYKKGIDRAERADIFFTNSGQSEMTVTVNDSLKYNYTLQVSPDVQCISLRADISSLEISLSPSDGFVGYGVVFEGSKGVSVHNFSVRSNSGLALFSTNSTVNSQINNFLKYDLVILQYGLNVMSPTVSDYSFYGKQLSRVVEYIKACFPQSAVMIMGVSDRCQQRDNKAVTMPSLFPLQKQQREVAQSTGVAFWSTFEAMGGENSMTVFVSKGWAAKDYTHINYKGGKAIAGELFKSINNEMNEVVAVDVSCLSDSNGTLSFD